MPAALDSLAESSAPADSHAGGENGKWAGNWDDSGSKNVSQWSVK